MPTSRRSSANGIGDTAAAEDARVALPAFLPTDFLAAGGVVPDTVCGFDFDLAAALFALVRADVPALAELDFTTVVLATAAARGLVFLEGFVGAVALLMTFDFFGVAALPRDAPPALVVLICCFPLAHPWTAA
ncbi:MAG: hypothetical protein H6978_07360 [Gammaproteobacteria bacterium]|nr:hypothetical protein [Gammaproteobacteria bacterium]